MSDVAATSVEGPIGILTIDSPPVNALGIAVRRGLESGLRQLLDDPAVKAVVLLCEGRTFFAGADISEFAKPPVSPTLYDILGQFEAAAKPIVAAIHGSALGGGLELALVCHYRIAVPSAKLGLPEVKLGLLPGGGGTQRLPRLIGAETAFELISTGRAVGAQEALGLGLIDALANESNLRAGAVDFARGIADKSPAPAQERDERLKAARDNPEIFDRFRARRPGPGGRKAHAAIVEAIEAAVTLPFSDGLARERALFAELRASVESKALRHRFFAEREASKVRGLSPSIAPLPIERVGVIGAGTMGSGIAMAFANAGIPVLLAEQNSKALDRGIAAIRRAYDGSVAKGRMTPAQSDERMARIVPAAGIVALAEADLVVEAAFEDMAVKKDIFARLDAVAKPGAILASNTSFLDLDEIAGATRRPESVIGLHFFSPAHIMSLLEIVRGRATTPEVLATGLSLAKRIGKVPIVSGVCHGFIANRIMSQRGKQANALLLQGLAPERIDAVMTGYGFPMGPFRMIDLAGLDVVGRGESERTLYGDFVLLGRLGQKSNAGFYDYEDGRSARSSPEAAEIIAAFARFSGAEPIAPPTDEEILFRMLLPVVNEGARLLAEGIAQRASDIDVAAMLGYGWPADTGGPMFWAETVGLRKFVDRLQDHAARFGEAFAPAPSLIALAAQDGSLFDAPPSNPSS